MPKFANPTAEALNDTLAPKRKVLKNMVKTFVDEKFPNLGTTEQNEIMYEKFVGILTDLFSNLAELVNYIVYAPTNPRSHQKTLNRGSVSEYFSRAIKATSNLDLFMNRIKTFNLFTPEQIDTISGLVATINEKYGLLKSSPQLSGETTIQYNMFQTSLTELGNLELVLQKVNGALGSYKQVPAGTSIQGAIQAIPIPSATNYSPLGPSGSGYSGGSIISSVGRSGAPFSSFSDGYTINSVNYSQPARFY